MQRITQAQKDRVKKFLQGIQDQLGKAFENIDGSAKFERKSWERSEGGGGTMGVIRGAVVEKAGANFSEVVGAEYPGLEPDLKGKPFYATGVSTITHMYNPYAPIGHMNVRLVEVGDTFWFGGGADLTPMIEFAEDTNEFHSYMKQSCSDYKDRSYEEFSRWCDEYFYIKHRNSVRGVGGIFFDYQKGDFEEHFAFIQRVASAYAEVFPKIIERRKDHSFTEEEKERQLYWRGRYAEFNLVYDRGTKFGLYTGGNTEAIFVSLPPVVKW